MLLRTLLQTVRWAYRGKPTVSFANGLKSKHVYKLCHSRFLYSQVSFPRPVFLNAEEYKNKVALVDQHGSYRYDELLHYSKLLSENLVKQMNIDGHLNFGRVAFLCENDVSYVVCQWAIWMLKGVAVPLCKSHPPNEIEYVIDNAQCSFVISNKEYLSTIEPVVKKLHLPLKVLERNDYIGYLDTDRNAWYDDNSYRDDCQKLLSENFYKDEPCLFIYTSGTTGRPKGVVLTYGNLHCNITGMIKAWDWSAKDVILHVLPLHHVHGVVNALMVPLFCGATCVMLPKFEAGEVWKKLSSENKTIYPINVFMAVPTIYAKLIQYYEEKKMHFTATSFQNIRLMVSGSASLPTSVMQKWKSVTGHTLLERYGMTELGMVLTNPLNGERVPGAVGNPFPDVQVAIGKPDINNRNEYAILATGNSGQISISNEMENEPGELLVKGPNVFKEYWNNPQATMESFTSGGWFKTGDTATFSKGVYRILGRTSVDIIKSGGYKISALDIERHLLEHSDILECSVIGLPDEIWGQKVAAIIVTKSGEQIEISQLKEWCSDKMPKYYIPTVLKNFYQIPKNAMGKINKKELAKMAFDI